MNGLVRYAGLVSTVVLLCGLLKFYIYYKQFGISILRFIDISEVFTLFMDNLLGYLAILIPTTLNLFIIYKGVGNRVFNLDYGALDSMKNDSKKRTCTVYKSEELKQIMF
jgi:F0F1-type ATP synthase assembly protein I